MFKKIDKWLTNGRGNWRFVIITGAIAAGAVALAFGSKISNLVIAGAVVNRIAEYHPPQKAVQGPKTAPLPGATEQPRTWTKTVLCDKVGCWDTNTERRLYLGAPK